MAFPTPRFAGALSCSRLVLAAALAGGIGCGSASAQQLVYHPTDPTFGGNPFNSAHLLGIASAQNKYKDPTSTSNGSSQADIFAQQLQSRLLSALSSQITDAIFGDNPQQHGVISFGGQTIEFNRDLENVTLTITDNDTGKVTNIIVPTFVKVSQ